MASPAAHVPLAPMPAISVVIPCYNAKLWIGATLRSVLAQDLPPTEVIVIDDGSSDGSADHVELEFPQVRVIRQPNAGVAAARNRGVREARSDWVAFVDADDIWLPAKLRMQCDALRAAPGAQLCYTAWRVWPSDDPEPPSALLATDACAGEAVSGPHGWIYSELLLDCAVWTSTTLMRRALFMELGGFDEQLRQGEDFDLWLRLSRRAEVARVDQPLALYRQHTASLTRSAPKTNWQALVLERALERWGLEGPDARRADGPAVSGVLARSWRNFALLHIRAGNPRLAVQAWARSLRLRWNDLDTWKVAVHGLLAWSGLGQRDRSASSSRFREGKG